MHKIRKATSLDLRAINAFYRSVGYGATANPGDICFVAEENSELIAVVRLCHEFNVTVLRGMEVIPAKQRKGIGHELLLELRNELDQSLAACWCLPLAHLESFYARIGFVSASEEKAPHFLAERRQDYIKRGFPTLLMYRSAQKT